MYKRYIHACSCVILDPANEQAEIAAISATLPRRATRRMSRLGLMLNHLLEHMPLNFSTTLVYGTTFTEVGALEKYLDSFPYASPLAFQQSIHPGGIEQALILRQQEVGVLLPLAGQRNLLPQLLKSAFLSGTLETVLSGGEEAGSWLKEFGLSSDSSYAFAMHLSEQEEGSIGSLEWNPESTLETNVALPSFEAAIRTFDERKNAIIDSSHHGRFSIQWQ
ncbi:MULTISPECIES: hypothetical protein [unclassified Lentimonas]|uniref:hypothetical protein n=1 Tax=unclassified Lentimonas TaxID=2630993 RepID=UPI001321C56A|nr:MULTISPECIES: hypothetical protein [unclassified Lentimonas]CAA6694606.1 Unannotated [Lentimonas sp. CC19]CAA6696544.1 Unannotated [Lentimonas sp. CC10]CAA7071371.1 Unannotated [Lentimonas sp. CC11]